MAALARFASQFLAAIIVVYLVLGVLYESLIHAPMILSTPPPVEAIDRSAPLRFRPTRIAIVTEHFGGLPLAIGAWVGSGAAQAVGHYDRWRPVDRADAHC